MQSVVTGQAPITLDRKITSGGKQIKTEHNTHNSWNKSHISGNNKRVTYVRTYQDTCHMLNESQQKPKPRRQHSTHKKKTGWSKRCPNRNRKREGRGEKIKITTYLVPCTRYLYSSSSYCCRCSLQQVPRSYWCTKKMTPIERAKATISQHVPPLRAQLADVVSTPSERRRHRDAERARRVQSIVSAL